ncbi:MAG: hypothetical protein V6Z86_05590 [Hyphomicrobiales bacterium]
MLENCEREILALEAGGVLQWEGYEKAIAPAREFERRRDLVETYAATFSELVEFRLREDAEFPVPQGMLDNIRRDTAVKLTVFVKELLKPEDGK